jgi:hypothetical protein
MVHPPQYEAHPAASLFEPLDGDELSALVSDVGKHGLRLPIVLHEGKVLDGRNRYAACRLAGVEPRFEEWRGEGDPAEWVLSVNLHRRHLSESQRAMVGARFLEYQKARTREREHARKTRTVENLPQSSPGKSRDKAGERVNVSGKSIEAAAKVYSSGAPELVRAVNKDRIAVSAAAGILDRPAEEQRAIVEKVVSGEAKSVRAAIQQARPLSDEERLVSYLEKLSSSLPGVAAVASSAADLLEELGVRLSGEEAANTFLKVEAARDELARLYQLATDR